MPTLRSAAPALALLVLAVGSARAEWMPASVSVQVARLGDGTYRYDYTVTNNDNRFPADFFDPYLGKVVPYAGSFITNFELKGVLVTAQGDRTTLSGYAQNTPRGQSSTFTLSSPFAPGLLVYEIHTGYVGAEAERSGGDSGLVLGPNSAPEPASCSLTAFGAAALLAAYGRRPFITRGRGSCRKAAGAL